MPWDGIRKRLSDRGVDPPEVILARIEERVMNMALNQVDFKRQFHDHLTDDKNCFGTLRKDILSTQRAVWMAAGAIAMVNLLPLAIKAIHDLTK